MTNQQETNSASDDQTRGLFFGDQLEEEASNSDFNRSLAVIIGINDYGNGVPPLRTARQDAERLAEILKQQYEYEIALRVDDVSGDKLKRLLTEELPAKIGENDRLIFYFAGHGIALEGDDGPAGYLIPQDADAGNRETFLPMLMVQQALTDLPCRHCLILMDCCFSGAFRWTSTRSVITPPEVLYKERYERFVRSPAWQVITSAAYDQEALDTLTGSGFGSREEGGQKHSPFARALFEALEGKGDANGDGVLIATELYLYLRDNVEIKAEEEASHHQTPGLWPLSKHDKGEFIFKLGEPDLPPAPEPNLENNPYRGLKSFDEKHADLFFGRTDLIKDLGQVVTRQPLTVVLGASGTGKSSLVKAGVVPHLRQETGQAWHILPVMRPTRTPLAELKAALTDGSIHIEDSTPTPVLDSPAESESFQQKAKKRLKNYFDLSRTAATPPPSANTQTLVKAIITWGQQNENKMLLLVIDQFEELVTLCRNDGERQEFLTLLATILEKLPNQLRVMLTLRSDFEPQLAALVQQYIPSNLNQHQAQSVNQYWQNARYIVPAMSSLDLREAIEEPASKRVLYFEPVTLVDTLIDEVSQTPGALPLLSFTLSEMYIKYVYEYSQGKSDDRALTQQYYDELGGVIGSLRQRANSEYETLEDEQKQATMRRVMLRMVVSQPGEIARQRVSEPELVYADEDENKRVKYVIEHLTAARLVVSDSIDGQTFYEPAHDALVNAWDQLRRWLDEAQDYWSLQQRLTQAALDWDRATDKKTKNSMLWHSDPRLPQLQQVLAKGGRRLGFFGRSWQAIFPSKKAFEGVTWLNRTESDFAKQSISRKGRNLRRSVATIIFVFLILAGLTVFSLISLEIANDESNMRATEVIVRTTAEAQAIRAKATAETEARIARAGQLAAQSQTVLDHQTTESLLLALESLAMIETEAPNQTAPGRALRQALQRSAGWPLPLVGTGTGMVSSALSPDGQWLVTGSDDGTVLLWSIENIEAPPRELPGHTEWVNVIAFSPDGSRLATGSDDGTVLVWSLTDDGLEKEPIKFTQGDWVWDVRFGPDGAWLITGSDDGKVMLWPLENPEADPELLGDFDVRVMKVGLQADGTVLAAGFEEGDIEARLWIMADETLKIPLEYNEIVLSLDISADGQWVAVGFEDGTGLLWAINDLESGPTLLNLPDGVNTIKFSPEGTLLAIGSADGTVCVWQMDNLQAAPMLLGHGTTISTITFVDEVGLITASQDDETMRLWWMHSLSADPKELFGHGDWIQALAFSPDGQWLATASEDFTVRLWPSETFADPFGSEPQILEGYTHWVTALAFSPDGQWLVTGDRGGNLHLRAMADPQVIAHSFQTDEPGVLTAAISPDSQRLATGHGDGTVKLWSIENPQTEPKELLIGQEDDEPVWDVSFSPDGNWLAIAGKDDTLLLYSMIDQGVEELKIGEGWIYTVEFSNDGRYLAAGAGDGRILLWEMVDSLDEPVPVVEKAIWTGHESAVRSIAISPDGQWLATGSEDDTVRLWAMDSFRAGSISTPESLPLKHNKDVLAVSFSPDGLWLATGGGENVARLWLTDLSAMKDIACEYAGRNFTQSEWEAYFPGEEYRQTCAGLPIHPSITNSE